MNGHRRIICVGLVALVGVVALYLWQPREPQFQGKPLSIWLKEFDQWSGDTNAPVVQATRHMGTNAAPILAHMILTKDSRSKKRIIAILEKYEILTRYDSTSDYEAWGRAEKALGVMGESACAAAPIFLNALKSDDQFLRLAALRGIASLGHHAEFCLPTIIALENDSDERIRGEMISVLGRIGRRLDLCMPVLSRGVENSDSWVRHHAVVALSEFNDERDEAAHVSP